MRGVWFSTPGEKDADRAARLAETPAEWEISPMTDVRRGAVDWTHLRAWSLQVSRRTFPNLLRLEWP
jgi:hypothetical protein